MECVREGFYSAIPKDVGSTSLIPQIHRSWHGMQHINAPGVNCSLCDRQVLKASRATFRDVKVMVCGEASLPDGLSIPNTFHVLVDEECEQGGAPVVECLWDILDAWQLPQRMAFIKFLTGTNKLPLPGTEILRLEMPFFPLTSRELKQQLGMLPQVGCVAFHGPKHDE